MDMSEGLSALPPVPSKVDQVYEYVKAEILAGHLPPGERLSMDALARALGVSRIPIREAMSRLESQGLVVQRMHVGPTVAPVSHQQLQGVYLTREAVEGLATKLAAERITDIQLEQLERYHLEMSTRLLRGEIDQLSAINSTFHLAIAEASGYMILFDIIDLLLLSVRRYRAVAPLNRENWRRVVTEHEEIIDALRRHDPDAAELASNRHVSSQASGEPIHTIRDHNGSSVGDSAQ